LHKLDNVSLCQKKHWKTCAGCRYRIIICEVCQACWYDIMYQTAIIPFVLSEIVFKFAIVRFSSASNKVLAVKVKRCNSLSLHLRATGCYLPYGITPDTGECTPPNPSQKGWYSIYLPREGWKAEFQ